jgi:imidazolonepropionase-like amidohydrolase
MITHDKRTVCFIRSVTFAFLSSLFNSYSSAQTTPPEGIRTNTPSVYALTNARINPSPGKVIEKGTLVIRDGIIESVGTAPPPADAVIRDMEGMTIYPGLIDAYSDYGMPKPPPRQQDGQPPQPKPPEPTGAQYWNPQVKADLRAVDLFKPDQKAAEKMRAQGITSALVVPQRGIFRGTSALVQTGDGTPNDLLVREKVSHHVSLQRDRSMEGYPESLMGVIALIRQTLLDADWYQKAQAAYTKNPKLPRPETSEALAALNELLAGQVPVTMETSSERDLFRADKLAKEFNFQLTVLGSGHEYKRLDAVKTTNRAIILPLNFPEVPEVQTPEEALQVSLAELRHWDEAPENPARLHGAGVQFAFTSANLKEGSSFLGQIRKAVERGLPKDAALASLTTVPARMFGVENRLGAIEPGKIADFIITDGDLFSEKTRVRETWVDGKRYNVNAIPEVDPRGTWELSISGVPERASLGLKGEVDALKGTFTLKKEVKLTNAVLTGLRLLISFPGDSIGYAGVVRMTATVTMTEMTGTGEWPDGKGFTWMGARTGPYVPEPDTTKPKPIVKASFPPSFPPGEFGRATLPPQLNAVLIKNATIWTCGPDGILREADLLIEKGKISRVGKNLTGPANALIIDATGKHVTPGLIDAHSHTASDGALNEGTQAISAEVRVGDVIDCDDINIYRQLAGGLTSAHVLHGSANPIGGQSQLIKLRWGMLPEQMKFAEAPPTIKFALGENVKQSNWGDQFTTRYPQTRMGVEQIMRDEFRAALDYEKAWKDYQENRTGIPPRKDLELEAILEILHGKRFVHCHSYRQDEILAMMRVAEDFSFRIRVFQHILEGYKVAEVMAKHGAGGSSFSDWWAYKLEVYDAIPYNGALMHEQGVLVSFNSDSDELARRLNTEAAKAVRYGGLSEDEAWKFVTINPAKQLKVDHRVGSLEAGKDADVVIWSGNPLSTYSACEQTWIDGRRFFDKEEDRMLSAENQRQRATLVQKALTAKKAAGETPREKKEKPKTEVELPYSCTRIEEGY